MGSGTIHTFRVRHGDMGRWGHRWGRGMGVRTWEGDMGFRVRHGDIHHMGTWGLGGMGWKGPMEPPETFICNMRTNLPANHAHNEIPTSRSKSTPML